MYAALGITGNRALLVSGIYNVVGPVANFIFITTLSDRVGRRKPLLFGTVAITLCLFCEAAINAHDSNGTNLALSRAGVAFIFMTSIFFSFSFGPVSWTYMSEVMPMQIRGKGNAFATGIGNWLVNVIFSQVSPQGLAKLGWKYYFVFAVFNIVVTLPTVFFVFKETKGVSLEEIDVVFGQRGVGMGKTVDGVIDGAERKTGDERVEVANV
jgi:MFS family permease